MREMAEIICHHCGRDYAKTYWAGAPSLENPTRKQCDPRVCPSCCRDTNPDAADAPQWVPPVAKESTALVRAIAVTPSRKKCRVCGGEWDGLIFGPAASKGSPLPLGICDACSAADEARMAALSAPVVSATAPLPEMRRPRRVVGIDYD